ncbi:MAG: AAA family ATPase [Nitrospirae bacterium]|nr:AAA family ATPase [Nitrospirota bacterium]
MIINKLKIDSFGCLSDKELEFKEGLNVILGPNEAGKSTAFNAIQKVLLTPVKLSKSEFKREIARFIPLGGDTIHVELSFLRNREPYIIKRTWGGTKKVELIFSDVSVITDEEEIIKQMDEILPAHPGTFKSVLMTYQSGLSKTLEELKGDYPETVYSLGDILRKAILETDGVSVDKFKEKIQGLYNSYFSRWDPEKQYPEKGRGIENPWQKDVGLILKAFYDKEKVRVSLEKARRFEEDLDTLNRRIADFFKTISVMEKCIQENRKPVEDARERSILNANLKATNGEIEVLTKVNSDWPVKESKIEELEKIIPALEKSIKVLEKEKQDSEIEGKNRTVREKFAKARLKKVAFDEAMEKLKAAKKLTKSDFEEIKNASLGVEKMKLSISAGKLSLRMKAEKEFTLSIRKDLADSYKQKITPGEPFKIEAGGILEIEHPEWQMEIASGEGNIGELRKKYKSVEENYSMLLKKHDVEAVEQAEKINEIYERIVGEVEKAKGILESELNGEYYDELESKIKEMGTEKEVRLLTKIVEELTDIRNKIDNSRKDLNDHKKVIAEYQEKYKDKKQLLLSLAKLMGEKEKIQEKLNNLSPLPEGIEDIDSFVKEYEKAEENLKNEKDKLSSLRESKAGLEGRAPEVSTEELEKQLSEAGETFRRILKKGEAISKIKNLTDRLLEEIDSATHIGLQKDLENYVSVMTENRYAEIRMEGGLPWGFVRGDGKVLSCELLSFGTKDVLALALRLSMTNYFLKEANGFLVMDDPLVDLDPERQKKAAEVLKKFAEQKQVLIFTCHPLHAELLGGHRIMLF